MLGLALSNRYVMCVCSCIGVQSKTLIITTWSQRVECVECRIYTTLCSSVFKVSDYVCVLCKCAGTCPTNRSAYLHRTQSTVSFCGPDKKHRLLSIVVYQTSIECDWRGADLCVATILFGQQLFNWFWNWDLSVENSMGIYLSSGATSMHNFFSPSSLVMRMCICVCEDSNIAVFCVDTDAIAIKIDHVYMDGFVLPFSYNDICWIFRTTLRQWGEIWELWYAEFGVKNTTKAY